MAELQVQGVVHWSIPVNNLEESEKFYGELLGLESKGRLGGSGMSCHALKPVSTISCFASARTR
jgi:catechol 2,3-dioxygenase-like lactoylglutathione lyase family enzyme